MRWAAWRVQSQWLLLQVPVFYPTDGVKNTEILSRKRDFLKKTPMFCSLIFEPRFPTVIYYVDLPWPEPWRCWLHHLQLSQCHPSGCLWSLWAPVLRWLLPPSLLKNNQSHGICWALASQQQIPGLEKKKIKIKKKKSRFLVTYHVWRPPPECLQPPSGKRCHSGLSPLELEPSRKTRNH